MSSDLIGSSQRWRHAFTLIEVVVALSVSLLVVVGLQSCLTLALQTIPKPSNPGQRELAAAEVLRQLCDELEYAQWVVDSKPGQLTFVVADRDGDGEPERIGYLWTNNGVGDVVRQYNDQLPRVVVDDALQFGLTMNVENVSMTLPGLVQSGATVLLDARDSSDFYVGEVNDTASCAQWLRPTTSSIAKLWRPRQLRVGLWQQGATSAAEMSAGPGLANRLPASSSLAFDSVTTSGLASRPNKTVFDTLSAPWVDQDQGYCFSFAKPAAATANVDYQLISGTNLARHDSTSWQHSSASSMAYELDGQWSSQLADWNLTLPHLTAARIECQSHANQPAVTATATLRNAPGQLSRHWVLRDGVNPTVVDQDADGLSDWQIKTSTLYEATNAHDLDADAVIDVDWSCITAGGEGIVLINAFRSVGMCRPVRLRLIRQADQTHYLILENPTSSSARPLYVLGGLRLETVRTRLVLSPSQRSVTLIVNGLPRGSFGLETSSVAASAAPLEVGSTGGGVDFARFEAKVWQ